jgi:hypothetical protein
MAKKSTAPAFRAHFNYDERLQNCIEDCERSALVVLANAGDGATTDLCKKCQIKLLQSMVMVACNAGVNDLARQPKTKSEDIEGLYFTDCHESFDDGETWQEFILNDDADGDHPVIRITVEYRPRSRPSW